MYILILQMKTSAVYVRTSVTRTPHSVLTMLDPIPVTADLVSSPAVIIPMLAMVSTSTSEGDSQRDQSQFPISFLFLSVHLPNFVFSFLLPP